MVFSVWRNFDSGNLGTSDLAIDSNQLAVARAVDIHLKQHTIRGKTDVSNNIIK